MSIGQRISECRKEHSYSQKYVAEQLGVSRQAVSKWETDLSVPDTNNLIGLSELFGVSVEYIATGKKPEPVPQVSPEVRIEYVPVPQKSSLGVQKIVGLIFLTVGLLSLLLGILLESLLFLGISILWSVIGGILLAVRRQIHRQNNCLLCTILKTQIVHPYKSKYFYSKPLTKRSYDGKICS